MSDQNESAAREFTSLAKKGIAPMITQKVPQRARQMTNLGFSSVIERADILLYLLFLLRNDLDSSTFQEYMRAIGKRTAITAMLRSYCAGFSPQFLAGYALSANQVNKSAIDCLIDGMTQACEGIECKVIDENIASVPYMLKPAGLTFHVQAIGFGNADFHHSRIAKDQLIVSWPSFGVNMGDLDFIQKMFSLTPGVERGLFGSLIKIYAESARRRSLAEYREELNTSLYQHLFAPPEKNLLCILMEEQKKGVMFRRHVLVEGGLIGCLKALRYEDNLKLSFSNTSIISPLLALVQKIRSIPTDIMREKTSMGFHVLSLVDPKGEKLNHYAAKQIGKVRQRRSGEKTLEFGEAN
jgi:hypothetical protein